MGRTLEVVEILNPLETVLSITRHVLALGRTIILQLVHAGAQLVEGLYRILDHDSPPARMVRIFGRGGSYDLEVAREDVGEDGIGLSGSARESLGVQSLDGDILEYLLRARVHEKRGKTRESRKGVDEEG